MSDIATKDDIIRLETAVTRFRKDVDAKFDDFEKRVDSKFDDFEKRVDSKLDDFEKRVDAKIDKAVDDLTDVIMQFAERVDERFNALEARVDTLEKQFDRLNNTLDAFLKRLDDVEKDNYARDHEIERMKRWIEQIAKKTGVQLDY